MNWTDFFSAVALVFVFEGIAPFVSPKGWKNVIAKMAEADNASIRTMGLGLIIVGLIALYLVRG